MTMGSRSICELEREREYRVTSWSCSIRELNEEYCKTAGSRNLIRKDMA